MKSFTLFLIFIIGVNLTVSAQCHVDSRTLEYKFGKVKGEVDSVVTINYRIDENGEEKEIERKSFLPGKDGYLGDQRTVDKSYSTRVTSKEYEYDEAGRVAKLTARNWTYGGATSYQYEYFYDVNGCDSLIKTTSYDLMGYGSGTEIYFIKFEIEGNIRTTSIYNDKGTSSKTIYHYNDQGLVIKEIEYMTRADNLDPDAKPWLITEYVYDDNGNQEKIVKKNNDGEVTDVYVYTYDEQGNMLKESGVDMGIENDPLAYADALLESIDQDFNGMENTYKYDQQGNVTEVKWRYDMSKDFAHKKVFIYYYKK